MVGISLDGKVALVSGGSRGIGRATALLLARAGAAVGVGYARDRDAADSVVAAIAQAGGRAAALAADLARWSEAERLARGCEAALGPIDLLVVNHGIWKPAPIEHMSEREWMETADVNLTGAVALCRAVAPSMKARRTGRIVLVSSTAGQRGEAGHAHYAATKGALISLTKSLAVELAGDGVLVNCVAPGWVDTDMTRDALAGAGGDAIRRAIPLGRPARPDEIAGAVLFLASDLAGFVCGEVLNVNGGAVLAG